MVVHQRVMERPKATGKQPRLFEDDPISNQYRYSAYITNLSFSPPDVWRLYSGRADAENRIKELKADFGFDSFNLDNFFGTEAALSIAMLAYNLMALFRQYVLNWKLPKEVIKKTKNLLLTFLKSQENELKLYSLNYATSLCSSATMQKQTWAFLFDFYQKLQQ